VSPTDAPGSSAGTAPSPQPSDSRRSASSHPTIPSGPSAGWRSAHVFTVLYDVVEFGGAWIDQPWSTINLAKRSQARVSGQR
jgi:hypothetical protein